MSLITAPLNAFYHFLFLMVQWYDLYVYTPIQIVSTPVVEKIPRAINLAGKRYTVFSANIVTYSRTLLIVPIAVCLKLGYYGTAFSLALFHDYLDHLDGIVAKVHKRFGYQDDPKLGSFLDAFCDKIVICTSLWSVLLLTDYSQMSTFGSIVFLAICSTIISYEVILGVVRVQDYYATSTTDESRNLAANMEGKLKEKLETIGLASLCFAMPSPLACTSGFVGLTSFFLAINLAHKSLAHKLNGRKQTKKTESENKPQQTPSSVDVGDASPQPVSTSANASTSASVNGSPSASTSGDRKPPIEYLNEVKEPYEFVFTIGCFDLFHHGHDNLFNTMKKAGEKLIVGVHSDESIFQLKNKWPIDKLEKRMENVKRYADVVFAIPSADPTPYILSAIPPFIKNGVFIRGDDMLNFPSRHAVEKFLDIKFVQYTPGVSSTMLRAKLLEQQKAAQA